MRRVVEESVLLARAYLSRVCEPGSFVLWTFIERVGPIEAARAIRLGVAPLEVMSLTAARRSSADAASDLDAAERHGARLVVPESDDWPHVAFGALERVAGPSKPGVCALVPPTALWVRGHADLARIDARSVAVVGARAATPYGTHVTAEMCFGLAAQGVAIVSGGAYGIDAAAHRAALAANGITVIVSAGGVDRPYPPSNATLYERALENGLVIAESPPGSAPHRSRFLSRNRLIAALGTGVVVVEAAVRSGARNTASHALALGRPLMVVPGPVTSAMSAGCHQLLAERVIDAILVTGWEDVLSVVGAIGEVLPEDGYVPHPAGDLRDDLDQLEPTSRRVFDALLLRRYLTAEAISRRSGIGVLDVVRTLPSLILTNLVESGASGYRVAKRVHAPQVKGA